MQVINHDPGALAAVSSPEPGGENFAQLAGVRIGAADPARVGVAVALDVVVWGEAASVWDCDEDRDGPPCALECWATKFNTDVIGPSAEQLGVGDHVRAVCVVWGWGWIRDSQY